MIKFDLRHFSETWNRAIANVNLKICYLLDLHKVAMSILKHFKKSIILLFLIQCSSMITECYKLGCGMWNANAEKRSIIQY